MFSKLNKSGVPSVNWGLKVMIDDSESEMLVGGVI